MKIPKTLKIGGHIIKVIEKDLGGHLDGQMNTRDNTIEIESQLPFSQKVATLIHEAIHHMNATWAETREGHMFLESFSQQMFQFLSDNKLLRK